MGDAGHCESRPDAAGFAAGRPPPGDIAPLRAGGLRRPEVEPYRDTPAALARLVEAEILPRLMLAHRAGRRPAPLRRPSPEDAARFGALLLAPGPADIDAEVDALLASGLPLPSLLLDLFTPAARHLGALWEEDACDFLAVTEALGRLQAISRRVCADLENEAVPPAGRSILLAPCPGETHLYGVQVVASFFREAGWDVTNACAGRGLDPFEAVRTGWFDAAGLSLSCDVRLPALTEAVSALRRASRNRDLRVLVGGPYFARPGASAEAVGADACAPDGRLAPAMAEALLDRRALAC